MEISREDLSRHYASLSDSELLAIPAHELTDLAQQCHRRELERRRLSEEAAPDDRLPEIDSHPEVPLDWLETAACACSFQVGTGRRYAEDAEHACAILRDAGIPSQAITEQQAGDPDLISVMVPGSLSLKAASVLDRDLFNEDLEEAWRTHFEQLSDDELRTLHPDDICAGLLDRAARLRRVYTEELTRRNSAAAVSN